LKNHSDFIVNVKHVNVMVKAFGFFEMDKTAHPLTQHHIPEDFDP
jgi:hypothetical protein